MQILQEMKGGASLEQEPRCLQGDISRVRKSCWTFKEYGGSHWEETKGMENSSASRTKDKVIKKKKKKQTVKKIR